MCVYYVIVVLYTVSACELSVRCFTKLAPRRGRICPNYVLVQIQKGQVLSHLSYRGNRIRTRIDGFGDRSSTIELYPFVTRLVYDSIEIKVCQQFIVGFLQIIATNHTISQKVSWK